jgi:hypothetical protein
MTTRRGVFGHLNFFPRHIGVKNSDNKNKSNRTTPKNLAQKIESKDPDDSDEDSIDSQEETKHNFSTDP